MSKTKLTVWVFTSEFAPHLIGGLGTVATHLTNAYSRNNRAIVLTENRFRQLKIEKRGQLKIIRFPSKTIAHTDPVVIHRWLTRRGYKLPSCIHIHSLVYARLAQYYRKQFRIPVVYTCHSLVALEKGKGGRKRASVNKQQRILKIADRIVVPSRRERQKLRRLYPFAGKKTVVIRHGVFTKSTMNTGQAHELLFVGRLISSKGIEPLLHAVALLKRKNKKVNLTVAGTGSRGYLAHLKSVVRKHGISSNVRWVGFRTPKQVRRMYASYGAVIMPSRSESFGLVALEALANGIPLVATRAGGLSEFVSDDVAQTIPKVEKKAIAASIERMWNNKKLTKKRVVAGRKLTLQYKWPRVAKQYLRLFRLVREETRTLKRR